MRLQRLTVVCRSKILKHGNPPSFRFECPYCGCVFIAPLSNVERRGGYAETECPQAGCLQTIHIDDLRASRCKPE